MSDLKFDKSWFKIADFKPATGIGSDHIREIAAAFAENIDSVHGLIGFIPRMVGISMRHQLAGDMATILHTGHLPLNKEEQKDDGLMARIEADQLEIVNEEELAEGLDSEKMGKFLVRSGNNAMRLFHRYGYNESAELRSLMVHMLYGAWTAFEVLVADLWIAALNFGPKTLAESVFKVAKEIGLKPDIDGARQKVEEKMIPLTSLADYGYDLRAKMGTMLSEERKVKFDSFENSLRAYEAAFGKKCLNILNKKTNKECANVAILEAVRNALIHRCGVVDAMLKRKIQHVSQSSSFPQLDGLMEGESILVDGEMTKTLVTSTMALGEQLLRFVDSQMDVHIPEYEI